MPLDLQYIYIYILRAAPAALAPCDISSRVCSEKQLFLLFDDWIVFLFTDRACGWSRTPELPQQYHQWYTTVSISTERQALRVRRNGPTGFFFS